MYHVCPCSIVVLASAILGIIIIIIILFRKQHHFTTVRRSSHSMLRRRGSCCSSHRHHVSLSCKEGRDGRTGQREDQEVTERKQVAKRKQGKETTLGVEPLQPCIFSASIFSADCAISGPPTHHHNFRHRHSSPAHPHLTASSSSRSAWPDFQRIFFAPKLSTHHRLGTSRTATVQRFIS